ncbi:MAG: tRNA (adenosine(37)-N6)-threonylcarbamoyltransferase complex dimerization subunit type 1 TsaB [Bacteroidales bacterium]
MALILHIETASPVCSVSLAIDGQVVALRESVEEKAHSSRLTVMMEELAQDAGRRLQELDALSLSIGPGSYTGLRIGTSVAKGMAYGLGIPVIGIPTLTALAGGFAMHLRQTGADPGGNALLCPMLDARRMEVYTALFGPGLTGIRPVEALIIQENSFTDLLDKQVVWFFGNGSGKADGVISHPNARFDAGFRLSATFQAEPAERLFQRGEFLDTAYFEPHYLKEFLATVPKNKVIG